MRTCQPLITSGRIPHRLAWFMALGLLAIAESAAAQNAVRLPSPSITILSVRPQEATSTVQTYGVTREDSAQLNELLPTVRGIVPIREVQRRARYGERTDDCLFVGTTAAFFRIRSIEAERGRLLTERDVKQLENVAVLGHTVAKRLFPFQDCVGKNVRINRHYYLVVGVLKATGDEQIDTSVLIPVSTMRSRVGDLEVRRSSGAFQMEQFELTRLEIVLTRRDDLPASASVVRSVMQQSHPDRDFEIRLNP